MTDKKKSLLFRYRVGLNVFLSLGVTLYAQENSYTKMPIAADSPFQSRWYKRALDTGMLIWSDMDALSRTAADDMMPDHRLLVLDASMGRLMYLEHCLKNLFNEVLEKEHADFGYLIRIIAGIEYACQELHKAGSCDRIACFRNILQRVDERLSWSDK